GGPPRLEGRARRLGEGFRVEPVLTDLGLLRQLGHPRTLRHPSPDEARELANVAGAIGACPQADTEVAEVGVPLGVEQDVGRGDAAMRHALAVWERERRGALP